MDLTVTIPTMPPTAPRHSCPKSAPSLQGPDLSNSITIPLLSLFSQQEKFSDFPKKIIFLQVVLLFSAKSFLTTLVTVELFFL